MRGRRSAQEEQEEQEVDEESGEEDEEDDEAGPRRHQDSRMQRGSGWAERKEPARAREKGLTGLPNLGNTCYLNSAMQALIHIEPFNKYFLDCHGFLPTRQDMNASMRQQSQRRLLLSLADLMSQVWMKGVAVAAPHDFVREVFELNPDYRGYGQQDSQEFLRRTLDALHEELQEEVKAPANADAGEETAGAGVGNGGGSRGEGSGEAGAKAAAGGDKDGEGGEDESRGKKKEREAKKMYWSIIYDIFLGIVSSEVRCNKCNKVSATHEPVLDQSISIPGKKARQRLASMNKGGRKVERGEDEEKGKEGEGKGSNVTCGSSSWLSFLFGIFSSSEPIRVSVMDCLQQYFEQEQLSGNDKYKCEHCDQHQDSTKKLSLIKLPEVMTLHIKRFRFDSYFGHMQGGSKISDHVDFPLNDLDMGQFCKVVDGQPGPKSTVYDLLAVVEHRGAYHGGHYIAYVRGDKGAWYEYDDMRVSQVSDAEVQQLEGYMLFYRLRAPDDKAEERKRVKEGVEKFEQEVEANQAAAEQAVYISRLWLLRFEHTLDPGPIDHEAFVCGHDRVHVPEGEEAKLQMISQPVWKELYEKYGGGPTLTSPIQCGQCVRELAELNRRRDHEHRIVHESDKTYVDPGHSWFIIDKRWLSSWLAFVNEEAQGPIPGPITNERLLKEDGVTPKEGLERGQSYRGVNKEVWSIFHSIYGGGPVIERQKLDIYSPPPPSRSQAALSFSAQPRVSRMT